MKTIINYLIRCAIFWIAITYFPAYVQMKDPVHIFVLCLLMYGIGWLYLLLMTGSIFAVPLMGCLMIMLAPFLTLIELIIFNKFYPGFHINNGWTYVVLALALTFLQISSKEEKSSAG